MLERGNSSEGINEIDAAKDIGVAPNTLARWSKRGLMTPLVMTHPRHTSRLYPEEEVLKGKVIAALTRPEKYGLSYKRMSIDDVSGVLSNPDWLENNRPLIEAVTKAVGSKKD